MKRLFFIYRVDKTNIFSPYEMLKQLKKYLWGSSNSNPIPISAHILSILIVFLEMPKLFQLLRPERPYIPMELVQSVTGFSEMTTARAWIILHLLCSSVSVFSFLSYKLSSQGAGAPAKYFLISHNFNIVLFGINLMRFGGASPLYAWIINFGFAGIISYIIYSNNYWYLRFLLSCTGLHVLTMYSGFNFLLLGIFGAAFWFLSNIEKINASSIMRAEELLANMTKFEWFWYFTCLGFPTFCQYIMIFFLGNLLSLITLILTILAIRYQEDLIHYYRVSIFARV